MTTQADAEKKLLNIIDSRPFIYQQWKDKQFAAMKMASTTEKGDIGEDFLAGLLKSAGYDDVQVVKGRRGQYDVSVKIGDKTAYFEVKVATLDIHNSFQFNGIRYDTRYTHLFCLGISPEKIGFLIIKKESLVNGDYKMVSMAKGSNSTFKLTQKESALLSFAEFKAVVSTLWD